MIGAGGSGSERTWKVDLSNGMLTNRGLTGILSGKSPELLVRDVELRWAVSRMCSPRAEPFVGPDSQLRQPAEFQPDLALLQQQPPHPAGPWWLQLPHVPSPLRLQRLPSAIGAALPPPAGKISSATRLRRSPSPNAGPPAGNRSSAICLRRSPSSNAGPLPSKQPLKVAGQLIP